MNNIAALIMEDLPESDEEIIGSVIEGIILNNFSNARRGDAESNYFMNMIGNCINEEGMIVEREITPLVSRLKREIGVIPYRTSVGPVLAFYVGMGTLGIGLYDSLVRGLDTLNAAAIFMGVYNVKAGINGSVKEQKVKYLNDILHKATIIPDETWARCVNEHAPDFKMAVEYRDKII